MCILYFENVSNHIFKIKKINCILYFNLIQTIHLKRNISYIYIYIGCEIFVTYYMMQQIPEDGHNRWQKHVGSLRPMDLIHKLYKQCC